MKNALHRTIPLAPSPASLGLGVSLSAWPPTA